MGFGTMAVRYLGRSAGQVGRRTSTVTPRLPKGRREAAEEFADVDPTGALAGQGERAGQFGAIGEREFEKRGTAINELATLLGERGAGQNLVSAEILRQGLQQQVAQQQALAAGARGGNQAMAARTAALQTGRLSSGLAGQQAVAGAQESQRAQEILAQLQTTAREQELRAALGGRGLSIEALAEIERARAGRFGAVMGAPSAREELLALLLGAGQAASAAYKPAGG